MSPTTDPTAVTSAVVVDAITAATRDGAAGFVRLLQHAAAFDRFAPANQLLLAAQDAAGAVATYTKWSTVTARNGEPCRVRRGETALRIVAPVRATRRIINPDSDDTVIAVADLGERLLPVFHEGQLVSPPAWPPRPPHGNHFDENAEIVAALHHFLHQPAHDADAGDVVEVLARYTHTIITDVRRDRPVTALETAATLAVLTSKLELGIQPPNPDDRAVTHLPTSDLHHIALAALTTTARVVHRLEEHLDRQFTVDPFIQLRRTTTISAVTTLPTRPAAIVELAVGVRDRGSGCVDERIAIQLARRFDWPQIAATLTEVDPHLARHAVTAAARAEVLADAGASTATVAEVLASGGHPRDETTAALTQTYPDLFGDITGLFPPEEIGPAIAAAYRPELATHPTTHPTAHTPRTERHEPTAGERDQFARRIILAAADLDGVVYGLANWANNPVEALRGARHARAYPDVLAGLITHYQWPPDIAAQQLHHAHADLDTAVSALLATAPTTTVALIAARANWHGHSDAFWIATARTVIGDRPDLPTQLPNPTPPPALAPATAPPRTPGRPAVASGHRLVDAWATIDSRHPTATDEQPVANVDLVAAWAEIDLTP